MNISMLTVVVFLPALGALGIALFVGPCGPESIWVSRPAAEAVSPRWLKYFLFLRLLHQLGLARSEPVATIGSDMNGSNSLPDDLAECHQLLLAAYRQSVQLEQKVTASQQQASELGRVLDETAASFEELNQTHAATLDELAWYKRWAFGRRRERFAEAEGQGHLFELDSPASDAPEEPAGQQEAETEVKGHRRRKKRRVKLRTRVPGKFFSSLF